MTATIMSPTPALPEIRRKTSVWGKMFSGFKSGDKTDSSVDNSIVFHEPFSTHKTRHASISPAVEKETVKAYKRTQSCAAGATETQRRPSMAPSYKSTKSISARSVISSMSRRSSNKWFGNNSTDSEDLPPVPAIDSKFAGFANYSLNPETSAPAESVVNTRRPSYVPRNAASSFLRSTTTSTMMKTTHDDQVNEASGPMSPSSERKASLTPLAMKSAELRKDSHVPADKHTMYSMVGVCKIIDEEQQNQAPVSPTSSSHSVERADSANGGSEVASTKSQSESAAPVLAPIAV